MVPRKSGALSCIGLAILLLLAACVGQQHDLPKTWGKIAAAADEDGCPDISGIYQNHGESPQGCQVHQEKCSDLRYSLLSGHTGYSEIWNEDSEPDFAFGTTHVELKVNDNRSIDVTLWQSERQDDGTIKRVHMTRHETLDRAHGGFSCGREGLILRPRYLYFMWGISNILGAETRIFNRSEDGALVMRSQRKAIGHHTFVPILESNTVWVRWPAAQATDD